MFKRTKIKWDLKAINTQIVAFIQQTAERERERKKSMRGSKRERKKKQQIDLSTEKI